MKLILVLFPFFFIILGCKKEDRIKMTSPNQIFADFIEYDSAFFDFGAIDIPEEGIIHTFILKNNSNDTLSISNVEAGCDCMELRYNKYFLLPKDTVNISVNYRSNEKQEFDKTIAIYFNEGRYYSLFGITGLSK